MPQIALQLTPEITAAACELAGVETHDVFGGAAYALIDVLGPTEFNFKLMSEDEIFEVVKDNSDLQVVSM